MYIETSTILPPKETKHKKEKIWVKIVQFNQVSLRYYPSLSKK